MHALATIIAALVFATPITPGVANALQRASVQTAEVPTSPDDGDDAPTSLFAEEAPRAYEDVHSLTAHDDLDAALIVLLARVDLDQEQRLHSQDCRGDIFRPPWLLA